MTADYSVEGGDTVEGDFWGDGAVCVRGAVESIHTGAVMTVQS